MCLNIFWRWTFLSGDRLLPKKCLDTLTFFGEADIFSWGIWFICQRVKSLCFLLPLFRLPSNMNTHMLDHNPYKQTPIQHTMGRSRQASSFGRSPPTVPTITLPKPDLLVGIYFYFYFYNNIYFYSEGLKKFNWFELLLYLNFRNP